MYKLIIEKNPTIQQFPLTPRNKCRYTDVHVQNHKTLYMIT